MTRKEAMNIVQNSGLSLKNLPDEWKNDKKIVLEAIKKDGYALYYASDQLKNDKGLVLESVRRKGRMLRHVSEPMRNDPAVVRAAISDDPGAFQYASLACKSNRDLVLDAVQLDGRLLKYCAEEYKMDREVILASIHDEDISALKYASASLLNDREIILKALSTHFSAAQYISPEWKNDRELISALYTFKIVTDPETGENLYESSQFKLQVPMNDLGKMNWYDALEACTSFGKEWKLPDLHTLSIIRKEMYLKGIGDFRSGYYWSSSELSRKSAKYIRFSDGISTNFYFPENHKKYNEFKVRPVRMIPQK
jgi:hypothetical protein